MNRIKKKMAMRSLLSLGIVMLALSSATYGQSERKFVRKGNSYYEKASADTSKVDTTMYGQAEIAYRKALDKKPDDPQWTLNLGDALYKQHKFAESGTQFEEVAQKATNNLEKSRALHNLGNSLLMQSKLDESIKAYKEALKNNPSDLDTKYNLLYAMNLKKKQQQQQQNKDKNKNDKDKDKDKKDQNKDQNKDQQNKDKNKDQNQDKKDQNKDQNKDQQNQNKDQQQQQQQQQNKISKENAERLLQALQNDEKKIQEKVKKMQAEKAKQRRTEKDW